MTESPTPGIPASPVAGATGAGATGAAGPVAKVRAGWIALLALANLGLYVGYYAPQEVLLPDQVQAVAGVHHVAALGWVTGIGAVVALVAQPLAGALSDRTASRFGRRRPWILGGSAVAAVGLALLAAQTTLAGVIVLWCVALAGLHAMQGSILAVVPDRVPVRQRGSISGWISIQETFGVVAAVALVSLLITGNIGYVATAVCVVALGAPFVFGTKDPPLARESRPPLRAREFLGSLWVSPRRHPDFAWAFVTRFLVLLGNSIAILYLLYYLRDDLHYSAHHPGQTDEDGLLILIVIYTVGVLLSAVTSGWLSDRSGRRKRHVVASGLFMAAAAIVLALWPTWPVTMLCALLLGLGFGVYLSVDLALVTEVLPSRAGHAKDLGIIYITTTASQALAPAIAAPIVDSLGYPALFVSVAVITVLGSSFVWKIRSVS